jgi:hypothetical protein
MAYDAYTENVILTENKLVQISAKAPTILTKVSHGFSRTLQEKCLEGNLN